MTTRSAGWLAAIRGAFGCIAAFAVIALPAALTGCGGGAATMMTDAGPEAADLTTGPADAGPDLSGPLCVVGTEGCQCDRGACAAGAGGSALVCTGGVCQDAKCPAGTRGCACNSGKCDSASDECTMGVCSDKSCTPGTANCRCVAGSCAAGLLCLNGQLCVDSTGYEGGACAKDGSCNSGNRCDTNQDRCVHCDLGTEACQVTANGSCNAGLGAYAGLCWPTATLPPRSPRCYTPCLAANVDADGGVVACDRGLRLGCVANQTCIDGACLAAGELRAKCATNVDCPDFQLCLRGQCYANCDTAADCASGYGCFRHACRAICKAADGAAACTISERCVGDGETGFCLPSSMVPSTPPPPQASDPTFTVTKSLLPFTNVTSKLGFQIGLGASPVPRTFTVRKVSHRRKNTPNDDVVVAPGIDVNTNTLTPCVPGKSCALSWVTLAGDGPGTYVPGANNETLKVTVPANCVLGCNVAGSCVGVPTTQQCPVIGLSAADPMTSSWDGQIEVALDGSKSRQVVTLSYRQRPDGQWNGSAYYFGAFSDDDGKLEHYPGTMVPWGMSTNALLRKWNDFRNGGFDSTELGDLVISAREETWRQAGTVAACNAQGSQDACYGRRKFKTLGQWVGSSAGALIPSGVTQLPIVMNLAPSAGDAKLYVGRVESSGTLHYPGIPEVRIRFASDPTAAAANVFFDSRATAPENALSVVVGKRYAPPTSSCDAGYRSVSVPWLLPGFTDGTSLPPQSAYRVRTDCRDTTLPFVTADDNVNFALANPVPNGVPLNRNVEFLDGVLVDGSTMYVLFRETFQTFVKRKANTPANAYGLLVLQRAPTASLSTADYVGTIAGAAATGTNKTAAGVSCDPATVASLGSNLTDDQVVNYLIDGNKTSVAPTPVTDLSQIHYLCEELGIFDGGTDDTGVGANKVACPITSKVRFFYTGTNLTQQKIADQPCQDTHTCGATLDGWIKSGAFVVDANPYVQCSPSSVDFCDPIDRLDLRQGPTAAVPKVFAYHGTPNSPVPTLIGLRAVVADAFRYKTMFQSTRGGSVGYSPQICAPISSDTPYCYDPDQIEQARKRIDCLVNYATNSKYATLPAATQNRLTAFLTAMFSEWGVATTDPAVRTDGFERLNAELMVNLGDDAVSAALSSRFDLAGVNSANFPGSQLEAGGEDVTGAAGAEFFHLYQATQYYQRALDRLYLLGANFAAALDQQAIGGTTKASPFITPTTVSDYFERLTRASTQKALAWSEIAKLYHQIQRTDLAERVVLRAYAGTYLEGALIAQLMNDVTRTADPSQKAGLRLILEDTQLRFGTALRDMRDVYAKLQQQADFFGYPSDYVPFPALELSGVTANAYSALADVARTRIAAADVREQTALSSNRTGRIDAATFTSELVNIRNTYENQLVAICGSFVGDDGAVYPAITKYNFKWSVLALVGDPCGRTQNGSLHEAALAIQDSAAGVDAAQKRYDAIAASIDDEVTRVAKNCQVTNDLAQSAFKLANEGTTLTKDRADTQAILDTTRAMLASASGAASLISGACGALPEGSTTCGVAVGTASVIARGETGVAIAQQVLTDQYNQKEANLGKRQNDQARLEGLSNCTLATNDSEARIKDLMRQQGQLQIDLLRTQIDVQSKLSNLQGLVNESKRLQGLQAQAERIAIDIEAAQNDPNVRIYQNDAVIEADIAFNDALSAAYAATRAFEYFTGQSYAKKKDLYLARLVSTGQKNLQDYLNGLDNAFLAYQQTYGQPDLRVMVVSLMDDILQIPYTAVDPVTGLQKTLQQQDRYDLLHKSLRDPRFFNASGYLTIPFSTAIEQLSPLTRNHKIYKIQAELQGSGAGDSLARVYVQLTGVGSVHQVDDETLFYALPQRTAVINASTAGGKPYDPAIYDSFHLRDRPLANTLWQVVLNLRDEPVNKDIVLSELSDIRLYIYYTDVTAY